MEYIPKDIRPAESKGLDAQLLNQASRGDLSGMRASLKQGADPMARTAEGHTALHIVMRTENDWIRYNEKGREIAAMMLNRGVDVNARDMAGQTPLHGVGRIPGYSCKHRLDDLLSFGADIEARDSAGRTPVFYAMENNKADALEHFIAAGAKVNVADNDGITPLHVAASTRDFEHVKRLLNAGANPDAVTKNGKTVWDFAMAADKDYLAQWLKAEAKKRRDEAARQKAEARAKQEQQKPRDPWALLSSDRVAHVQNEPAIGYRLTEIFNFHARTYTQIAHNLNTRTDTMTVKTFDEFTDRTPLEKAHSELERLGGTADRAVINGPLVEKPRPAGLKLPK